MGKSLLEKVGMDVVIKITVAGGNYHWLKFAVLSLRIFPSHMEFSKSNFVDPKFYSSLLSEFNFSKNPFFYFFRGNQNRSRALRRREGADVWHHSRVAGVRCSNPEP